MADRITRRRLLAMAAAAPVVAPVIGFGGTTAEARSKPVLVVTLEPDEEWKIGPGPTNDDCLTIKVWANHSISVYLGVERLRRTQIERGGWQTFRGRGGTAIKLRRSDEGYVDVMYFMIAAPTTYHVGSQPQLFRGWTEVRSQRRRGLGSGLR